jgi:tetratricopeptide (TPR) repeat protein
MQANVKKATDLAANASEAERLFIQGYQLNTSQQPDKAIETLQQLIKVQPTAKRALVYLGTILAGRNRVDDALIHYNQALKIDPGFIPAHANRATALINKGDAAGARKDYLFVVERVPEGPTRINPLSQVALAYAYDGNTAEAGNYYEQAIALAQKANQATTVAGFCNALARIYLEHGDLINATKLYQRGYEAAMAGAPADQKPLWEARYYHARSRILAKVGEYDAAVEYVDKLQAIIDTGAEPKQHLSQIFQYLVGYIHLDRGRYDQAIGHLSRADQNDAFIQLLTARAYEGKGDAANAAVWYKKVLEYHGGGASTVLARPWAEKWVKEKAGR